MSEGSKKQESGKPGLDGVGLIAYLLFVVVGGVLVFGFSWSLLPAARAQQNAACRPLEPKILDVDAPATVLETLDGEAFDLSNLRGKFVVLNFWATWCEPCSREWPDLAQLGERFANDEDVVVLAVSIDQEKEAIAPYLEGLHLTDTPVKVLWDPSGKINKDYGSEKIPDTYFIDQQGKIQQVFVNVRQWGRSQAFRCVEAAAG